MSRQRRFFRVRCTVKASLDLNGHVYRGHVENVSVNGALIRVAEAVVGRPGQSCRLLLHQDDGKVPLRVQAELIHVGFSMAGMRFTDLDEKVTTALVSFLETICMEGEVLRRDMVVLREEG